MKNHTKKESEQMANYKEVENKLKAIASKIIYKTNIPTPFNGVNLMTNNIVLRGKMTNGVWFELSYGRGMGDYYLYGVTLKHDKLYVKSLQDCCTTFEQVEDILTQANKL